MTYNIRLGMQRGVARIAEIINEHTPDIVALQEVGRHWRMGPPRDTTREISEQTALSHSDFVATICEDTDESGLAEYGHAVLSRWPIERVERFDFTRDIDEPRAACLYRVDTPGGPLMLLATHLSHRDEERAVHGPELLKLVAKHSADDAPLIVLGDLNESSNERVWLEELTQVLDDAAAASGLDGKTFPAEEPERRIDYLLASRGQWSNYEVIEEVFASDHRPVVADWSDA